MSVNLSVIGKKLEPSVYEYSEKDVILYALGVGCGREQLPFVYEQDLKVLPTFAVVPAFPALFAMGSAMDVNPMMVLHGEQRIELALPIPTSGRLTTTPTVTAIYDKGKGALVVIETETVDARGKLLFKNAFGAFARGEGGFGGDRGPSGAARTSLIAARAARSFSARMDSTTSAGIPAMSTGGRMGSYKKATAERRASNAPATETAKSVTTSFGTPTARFATISFMMIGSFVRCTFAIRRLSPRIRPASPACRIQTDRRLPLRTGSARQWGALRIGPAS